MSWIFLAALSNRSVSVSAVRFAVLETGLQWGVAKPPESTYESLRSLRKTLIDRESGAIVGCNGAADGVRAVPLATDQRLGFASKGGNCRRDDRHRGLAFDNLHSAKKSRMLSQ